MADHVIWRFFSISPRKMRLVMFCNFLIVNNSNKETKTNNELILQTINIYASMHA